MPKNDSVLVPDKPVKQVKMQKNGLTKTSNRWWLEKDDNLYHSVFAVCNTIETQMQTLRHQFRMYRHLYGNPEAYFIPSSPSAKMATENSPNRRVQVNVIQSCIDTAASMIAKNEPKPQFMTLGEDDYDLQQQAKLLTQYVEGVFDNCGQEGENIHQVMRRAFFDAAISGTGAVNIYQADDNSIKVEWIHIDELLIDSIESFRMNPRQIHRRKFIHRDVLMEMYPDKAEYIQDSSYMSTISSGNSETTADLVEVIESWHLKSGKKGKDGKHSICTDNCTLFSEEYKKPFYPIVFFRWAERPQGFWGRGITEELVSIQTRINEILRVIQIAQELIAIPIIFVEDNANVNLDHMVNTNVARIIEYAGQPPIILAPEAVSRELYQHVDWLLQQAYQITGVSQANATGTAQTNLKSGNAIQLVSDIASGRFELVGKAWERAYIQLSKIIISLSKDLYKENKDLSVKVRDRKAKFIKEVKFADVDLDEEEFDVRVFPVSGLPSTPAGKMEVIMQFIQSGWLDQDEGMELIGFPDLDDTVEMKTAPLELIRKALSRMINESKPYTPTEFMNLQVAIQVATQELSRSELNNVPEERLQLIRNFIDDCNQLMNKQEQQQAPQQPAQPPPQQQQAPGQAPPNMSPPTTQ